MKRKITMAAIAIIIMIQLGFSGVNGAKFATTEQKIAFAMKNYLAGLQSKNPGVVNAAMRLSAQLKLRYPETDVTILLNELKNLSMQHPSGCVRYKAYIATSICSDPEWYMQEQSIITADDQSFFYAASVRLQEKLYTASSF